MTPFPQINGFTQFVDGFVQNTENEYQFIIDNDNEEFAVFISQWCRFIVTTFLTSQKY